MSGDSTTWIGTTGAALRTLGAWGARRWLTAAVAAVAFTVLVGIPTDLIDTPVFGREIPPTWWSWPALALSAVLAGLLAGTYVTSSQPEDRTARRSGWLGATLTFFAVGCPVCNKIVLLAVGASGALTWFEPVQPVLQVAAAALLGWALRARLLGAVACPAPAPGPASPSDPIDRGVPHV